MINFVHQKQINNTVKWGDFMSNDLYRIEIGDWEYKSDKKDTISQLRSLKKISKLTPEEEEETKTAFKLSEISKSKKKKKKDKKKKKLDMEMDVIHHGQLIDGKSNSDDSYDPTFIDIDEILSEEDAERDISDMIIGEQRNSYDKLKKDGNQYKKTYAEELTILYDLLEDLTRFGKDLEKKYKALDSSRVRGISKYTNDLIMAILTSKSNKLSILREITSIKTKIEDFKLKAEAKAAKSENTHTVENLAASYFQKVLDHGRNRFMDHAGVSGITQYREDDGDDDFYDEIMDEGGTNDSLANRTLAEIESRLQSEGNIFRSAAGNKYIEYENRGVKEYIKRCIDTGDWEFIAIDRDNQQIYDYPLPRKKDVGKVRFSEDGKMATDDRGRSYKVIEYWSSDEVYEEQEE